MFDELDPDPNHSDPTDGMDEHSLAFLLRANLGSDRLDPAHARPGNPRKLEIVAFVGEEVFDVQQIPVDCTGVELGCDSLDPTAPSLIRRSGSGGDANAGAFPRLQHDARGWVFLPTFDIVAYVDVADATSDPVRRPVSGETVLGRDDRLLVEIGAVIYVIQEVQPARRVPGEPVSVDTPMMSLLSFLGAGAAMFGYALGVVPPPPESSLVDGEKVAAILNLMRIPPPPPAVAHPAGPAVGKHKGAEGVAPRGPKGRDSTKAPRNPGLTVFQALDATLQSIEGSDLPGSILNAASVLHGRPTSNGKDGFSVRGDEIGGGGHTDSVGWVLTTNDGPDSSLGHLIGEKQDGKVVPAGEPITLGGLDPAEIDRVIKHNMASIRYCYQKELQSHPGIGGKISVKFTIAGDGSVSSATTRPVTPMPAVEACLTARFLHMRFPEPKGKGMVLVTYPFVFSE